MDPHAGSPPGTFVAVVGASGVGKDTIMRLAHRSLRDEPRVHFLKRAITRPPEPSEDHEALDVDEFAVRLARGEYALHWEAHGLLYGLPLASLRRLDRGHCVVANVSRAVLKDIITRYPRHAIVEIVANPELRALRIGSRQRPTDGSAEKRLARHVAVPDGCGIVTIENNGRAEDAASIFVDVLLGTLRRPPAPR